MHSKIAGAIGRQFAVNGEVTMTVDKRSDRTGDTQAHEPNPVDKVKVDNLQRDTGGTHWTSEELKKERVNIIVQDFELSCDQVEQIVALLRPRR